MFEISWSEFLIVAVVALIFIGPKELPAFFHTLGRYAGVIRRQAAEFRGYFEEAMREAELEKLGQDLDVVRDNVRTSMAEIEAAARVEAERAKAETASATGSAERAVGGAGARSMSEPAPAAVASGSDNKAHG